MKKDTLTQLFEIISRKYIIDKQNNWNSSIYLSEIKKELDEVQEEIQNEKQIFLEDELGDVLYDFCSALYSLEKEGKIRKDVVLQNVIKKYDERISAIEKDIPWDEIKVKQKKELETRQLLFEKEN